jgi:tetratricopeptide (TPR) repeat protein
VKPTLRHNFVPTFRTIALCTAGLFGIFGVLAASNPAAAQIRPTPKINTTPSIMNFDTDAGKAHKSGVKEPVTQQMLAEAILGDSMRDLDERIDAHFHKGEYSHCINLNRILVQGIPQDVEAYGNAAYLLWSTDHNDEAIAFLKQGITANPSNYYLYDELGMHYALLMKDPARGLPYYEQAVKFDCPALTWNGLANCYEKTNQWDKAVEAWQSAAKFPNNLIAVRRLDRARNRLGATPDAHAGTR